jgi:hypothetical protein
VKFKILAALAALALAQPAAAATSFGATVDEGQYQTFTIRHSGTDGFGIAIFQSVFIYGGGPGQPEVLNNASNDDKICLITSFPTSCANNFVSVQAAGWGDVISLYISFGNSSFDHCDTLAGSSCALLLSPASVGLRNKSFDSDGTYEVLSSGGGAVPEPATWAMMIVGFGLAGAALRRRPNAAVSL